jgi:2'-5' RNA ligase
MIDPRDNKTIGYHLFFEPVGEIATELQSLITKVANEFNAPVFNPHVTLLARIPEQSEDILIEKTKELAHLLVPITLSFGNLNTQDAYFKTLYIEITEKDQMIEYHKKASGLFETPDEGVYFPHLSLLYGNYPPEKKLFALQSIILPQQKAFVADKIHLYKTEGETQNWKKIFTIELSLSQ